MSGCAARYYLNRAVRCYREGDHTTHEGIYLLAGRRVTWTDNDKRPEPLPLKATPVAPTAMEEALRRAGLTARSL